MIGAWDISGPHIAERTSLFVLIALGEGLLVAGFAFVGTESSTETIIALGAAFVAAAAAWWIYFDHGERIGSEAIEAADEPGRLARTAYTWVHLAIIAGIVLMSVGDKEALGHPHSAAASPSTVILLGGPLLFLIGTTLFRRVLEHRWARAHVAGIAAIAVLAVASPLFDALTLSVAAAGGARRWSRSARPSAGCAAGGARRAERAAGPSALDDVDREPALARLLVLRRHVDAGLAHRLDDRVERHVVRAVAAQGETGGGDGGGCRDRVALDARDLHEPADRVAREPEVVLHRDLGRVLDLPGGAAHHGGEAAGGHRAGRPDLGLAAALGARDRGVGLEQGARARSP